MLLSLLNKTYEKENLQNAKIIPLICNDVITTRTLDQRLLLYLVFIASIKSETTKLYGKQHQHALILVCKFLGGPKTRSMIKVYYFTSTFIKPVATKCNKKRDKHALILPGRRL